MTCLSVGRWGWGALWQASSRHTETLMMSPGADGGETTLEDFGSADSWSSAFPLPRTFPPSFPPISLLRCRGSNRLLRARLWNFSGGSDSPPPPILVFCFFLNPPLGAASCRPADKFTPPGCVCVFFLLLYKTLLRRLQTHCIVPNELIK